MKNAARVCLALVVVAAATAVLTRPGSSVAAAGPVQVVPTPTLPGGILHSPKPSPSPSPSPTATSQGGGGGGTHSGSGGGHGSGGGTSSSKKGKAGGHNKKTTNKLHNAKSKAKKLAARKKRHRKNKVAPPSGYVQLPGAWTTDKLVAVAAQLRAIGWSRDAIEHRVFAPFILGGPADWIDSWHFPRYGPAPGEVRLHEGQDVFCNYGEPVLATQDGTIQYDSGGLGGNIARLFRPDGTYWYYAHLTGWNDKQFPSGSQVHAGDVIGYCGNSGDAAGGPTHVHFGWYQPNGVKAMNPLSHLLTWLHEAQRNALGLVGTAQTKRIKELPSITVERRFGDSLVPFSFETSSQAGDVSTDTPNATVGVFGLTQTALQAALSETTIAQTSSAASGLQASQAYTEKITTSQSSSVHQREENGGD